MAVVNRNSAQIINALATPPVRDNTFNSDGALVSKIARLANAADDDATSVHRVVRIHSGANIRSIKMSTGDATTAGAFDLGVYYAADHYDGALAGDVIDADFFASAFALTNGPYEKAELAFESGVYDQTKQQQPLWQALGLTADPDTWFDIAVTVSTTYNGASVGQLFEVIFVQ